MNQLFKIKPKQWGFRGDPYLWDDMEKEIIKYTKPDNLAEFEKIIIELFTKLTQQELKTDHFFKVEKYSHGGMSSGGISCDFWLEEAIPLLKRRFKEFYL